MAKEPPKDKEKDKSNRVEHDPYNDTITIYIGNVAMPVPYKTDPAADKEAKDLADELDKIFRRCDYPDKAFNDRFTEIATISFANSGGK